MLACQLLFHLSVKYDTICSSAIDVNPRNSAADFNGKQRSFNMKMMKIKLIILFLAGLILVNLLPAQTVKTDTSTCKMIFHLLKQMKAGKPLTEIEPQLDTILKSEAYVVMFKHYNRSWRPNHLPEDVFKRLILSLQFPEKYTKGENERADQMLPFWQEYYGNLDMYERYMTELEKVDLQELVDGAAENARQWLPPEMKIPDFTLYVIPHGGSGGFVLDNAQGYDFFKLDRDKSGNLLPQFFAEIIAHECHHLGLEIPQPEFVKYTDTLAYFFLNIFVGEGTASKFINNLPGGAVPRIDKDRKNNHILEAFISDTWESYTKEEQAIFDRMCRSFELVYTGKMGQEDVDKEMREYWVPGKTGRFYFLGCELFGAIYYGFGKEGCFEAMRDPRKMFDLYNKAIDKNKEVLGKCPRIPEGIVKMALSIGP